MRIHYSIFLLFTSLIFACQSSRSVFMLVDEDSQADIYLPENTSEPVRLAVGDLVSDVEKISGKKLKVLGKRNSKGPHLMIFNLADTQQHSEAISLYPGLGTLTGQWESFVVQHVMREGQSHLLIAGSDERGTMFGIYHFIEKYLEVDPLYFWKDRGPLPEKKLSWAGIHEKSAPPTFKYRGWFINDEDLLTEWKMSGKKRDIDYPYYADVVDTSVMERVVEALLRLRMNLIIPASFIDIHNPAEEALVKVAARRGVFISQHHVEPMGVSAFSFFNYWEKKGKKPLFSFYSSRSEIEEVWKYYAEKWAQYPNVIWQIGLRGIADRPMWMADPNVPQTDEERGDLISEAMQVQMDMIAAVDQREAPPVTTTLWAEGSVFNQKGYLQIPSGVMVIFSDNSPGWKWQQDFYETQRNPERKYGVYYHHQLWGSGPHLAQGIPPKQTYQVIGEAVKHQASEYAIMNVSNVREFALGLAASSQMLYDFQDFDPEEFMVEWIAKNYSGEHDNITKAYQQYFDAFEIHPETKTPMFLDGQTRSQGSKLLKKLELQITDIEKYKAEEAKAEQMSEGRSWGSTHLSDMHPEIDALDEKLKYIRKQREGFEKAYSLADEALNKLGDPTSEDLLKTNLISQSLIMQGLSEWLENIILAKMAYDQNDTDASVLHLKNAKQAFDTIQQGLSMNSQGEKWGHWYRGDKKMNLGDLESFTEKVLEEAMA